jgi:SulP family sulfate permease
VWLALLSGALQLALGWGGYGWLLNLISSPVLMGFTQAAALLIIASQLPALLGASGTLSAWLANPHLHGMATLYGLLSVALLVLGKRWWPRFPMMVFVVGGACALSAWSGFSQQTALVIGALPAGLSLPALPAWDTLAALLVPAMVIALVSFLETASSAKVEAQRDGRQWHDNQDLMGQGLGKLASALCGSFPTSSSFSRSAINLYAGARTGWATVIMVGFVLLAVPRAQGRALGRGDRGGDGVAPTPRPDQTVAHFTRRSDYRPHHLCRDALDRSAHPLGRTRGGAAEPDAFSLPTPAPAHHRNWLAP